MRPAMKPRKRPPGSFRAPNCPQTSNNIIQKRLAFVAEPSGSVTVPGATRASGSCPAGCMAEVGAGRWFLESANVESETIILA
jgi:hypothetical protein